MISALLPTIRTDISNTIISLIHQGLSELVILDEGDSSCMSNINVRYACDMLMANKIMVRHTRRLKQGIGRARYDLIQMATNDTCLFIDDDNVAAPKCVEKLISEEVWDSGSFIAPAIILVNNEFGVPGYEQPKPHWSEFEVLDKGLWEPQFRSTAEPHLVAVKQTSTNFVLFNRKGKDFEKLKTHNQLGEDQVFCNAFEGGWIRTDAISYHFMKNDETRKWKDQAEKIYRESLQ